MQHIRRIHLDPQNTNLLLHLKRIPFFSKLTTGFGAFHCATAPRAKKIPSKAPRQIPATRNPFILSASFSCVDCKTDQSTLIASVSHAQSFALQRCIRLQKWIGEGIATAKRKAHKRTKRAQMLRRFIYYLSNRPSRQRTNTKFVCPLRLNSDRIAYSEVSSALKLPSFGAKDDRHAVPCLGFSRRPPRLHFPPNLRSCAVSTAH